MSFFENLKFFPGFFPTVKRLKFLNRKISLFYFIIFEIPSWWMSTIDLRSFKKYNE